jgi:hypothetical protein
MRIRHVPYATLLTTAFPLVGCHDPGNSPVVPPATQPAATGPLTTGGPQVQIQPLPADKLAEILGVTIWTAKFSGGPIQCWLEIEEEGQSTLPKRIPDNNYVGAGAANRPTEGMIYFWIKRKPDHQGGDIWIDVADAIQGYGFREDGFTYTWGTFFSTWTQHGSGELMKAEPGKEFVIIKYDADEPGEAGSKKPHRHVRMKLMGRFPVKK